MIEKKDTYDFLKEHFKEKSLEVVKEYFSKEHKKLEIRSQKEQLIIGDLLTTLELELKKEIKAIS